MKKQLLLWSMLICVFSFVNAQNIEFTDQNFKQALLNHDPVIDTGGDGEINIAEANLITKLNLIEKGISNLEGIEYFSNLNSLSIGNNELTEIDLTSNTNLTELYAFYNQLTEIDLTSNINLTRLSLHSNELIEIDLTNNINLTFLVLLDNDLTKIDLTNNINLIELYLSQNPLTEIDLINNINLSILELFSNKLTEIDLLNNTKLTKLTIFNNQLTEINLVNNTNLTFLSLYNNQLTEIELTNNTNLTWLSVASNQLSEIDIVNNTNLTELYLSNNLLTEIDVRPCSLTTLYFPGNPNLKKVYMTGQPLEYWTNNDGEEILNLLLFNCPNLEFICAEQGYLNDIYSLLETANQTSCILSSDCDAPNNLVQGNLTYDLDNDGCGDEDDVAFTHEIPVNIFSGTGDVITAFPNREGRYTVSIKDGTYQFIPNLAQHENYFHIYNQPIFNPLEPGTAIPEDIDNLVTDFCVQPIDDFNDLEISIFPLSIAQPGVNASYLIRYKNIGTTVQSGSVTLDYEDDVLDYVSSSVNIASNSNGQLTWNFTNLPPMETIKITLTFQLNTPTDTPPLNGGDILNYTATIIGATDETPDNNVMELAQTVVNSYDPNNKTCLEGNILDPNDVGGYLHYLIRFENEGTAAARNVTVTDVIDTSKFDINSFIPLEGSHSFTTTISNENEIEFIFNDINLPFDDENNDGYVLFKIKTLDTLVEGDEIVNGAAIYFDFNLPILTEDSVVIVEDNSITLSNNEEVFSKNIGLFPNPVINKLHINSEIELESISIYNLSGVLIKTTVFSNNKTAQSIDLNELSKGVYFAEFGSGNNVITKKIIKK